MARRVAGLRGTEETGCYAGPRQQYIVTNSPAGGIGGPFWLLMMRSTMRLKAALTAAIALAIASPAALAKPGGWRAQGGSHPQQYAQQRQFPLFAQQRQMPPPGYGGRMNPEDRQKMRDDMRWANREPGRDSPPPRDVQPGRMSPEEREKLRRDVMDANREMPRDRPRDMRRDRGRW